MLTLVRLFCNARLSARKYNISSIYQNMIYEKYMLTDYCNTDSPTENIKFQNAINDANSNCSPEFIWQSLLEFLKSALGLVTYGTIILTVSPWILLLLIISAIVIYFWDLGNENTLNITRISCLHWIVKLRIFQKFLQASIMQKIFVFLIYLNGLAICY